ncbi:MAG: RnfABCDGE type electron transport complex subunit B [Oscillospiraceae bacterium]|nr:RnfABCDGE type electron transport complex subunit B [Oscillospiraceae bacterium]
MGITSAIMIISGIGIIAAVVLVLAAKFMHVEEDERIGKVVECLPGANCGACGYAGCADYAKAIVEKDAPLNLCIPGGADAAAGAAKVMGKVAGASVSLKAVVACQGFDCNTTKKYEYQGVSTCAAASKMFAGPSACAYGCLGFGDCKVACPFGAMEIVNGVALVNQEKCTGCGACTKACPKGIISLIPDDVNPVVLCQNVDKGAQTRKVCSTGCIGCMKCTKVCPTNAISVENNLARIDQDLCIACMQCASECPVSAIHVPNLRIYK